MRKISLLTLLAAVVVALVAFMGHEGFSFSGDMTVAADADVGDAEPGGSAVAVLSQDESTLVVAGVYSGLTGPATNAHIHGPATEDESAGVVFPLEFVEEANGTVSGVWEDMTPEQVQELRDGLYYVNVHTERNGPGEVRAQLQ